MAVWTKDKPYPYDYGQSSPVHDGVPHSGGAMTCTCGWHCPQGIPDTLKHFRAHIAAVLGMAAVQGKVDALLLSPTPDFFTADAVESATWTTASADKIKADILDAKAKLEKQKPFIPHEQATSLIDKFTGTPKDSLFKALYPTDPGPVDWEATFKGKHADYVIMDEVADMGTNFGAVYGGGPFPPDIESGMPLTHTVTHTVILAVEALADMATVPKTTGDLLGYGIKHWGVPLDGSWVESVFKDEVGNTHVTYAWHEPNMGGSHG